MKQITKRTALKAFKKGKLVTIVMSPANWQSFTSRTVSPDTWDTLENAIDNHRHFFQNKNTGKRVLFYVGNHVAI